MRRLSLLPLVLGSALLLAGAEASARATVAIPLAPAFTTAQLSAYAGNDWISNGGDLADDRYSTLTQITPSNVAKLKLAWHINLGVCAVDPATGTKDQTCGSQEENAVVYQGIMYIATAKSDVFALDATNGNVLWHYVPTFDPGFSIGTGGRQPGVSIGQGLVFLGQRDGKIVALNQGDGSIAWVASEGPWQKGIRLAETPMYFNGEVIEGNTGADGGSYSNSMQAFNATTGELMWNWNVVPSHNQPFGNTWPWSGVHSNYGGGAMWENPSIDPKLHSVIFGTGNPVPWNSRGPGADYWTDSIVSLDANTGYLNWAYQTVHHDLWDSDLPEGSTQFDMTIGGKTVHAVADVAKFGWTWILNAATGQPLEPVKNVAVPQDSAADVNTAPVQPIPQSPNTLTGGYAGVGYDLALKGGSGRLCANATRWTGLTAPDGKPYLISCHFQPYDTSQFVVAPFESMDWPAGSFDPLTNGYITCGVTNRSYGKEQVPAASQIVGSAGGVGSGILSVADSSIDPLNLNDFGNFSSLNMATVNPTHGGAWQWHQIWQAPCYSGTVNTASGLTFVGHLGLGNAQNGLGYLAAVDSKTGTELWESPLMDAPAAAPPITYSVNGVQYVSEVVGGESHNDPTRPNPSNPSQRVRGDSVYTYILGS
jgi:alcohol dehydrogenase (cytochrome c)